MQLFFKWAKRHFLAILCSMAFAITLFALIAPWLFATHSSSIAFNSNTGAIGDTFGIMNPFIAIAAALITFAAFWTQYQANQEMQKNSDKMQFERQFYEMLKIHCDKVENLHAESLYTDSATGNQSQKAAKSQDFFRSLLDEFNLIYSELLKFNETDETFCKAYHIFFSGIDFADKQLRKETTAHFHSFFAPENNKYLFMEKYPKLAPIADSLFMGHIDQLVPYYRHLFLLVKTVVQFDDKLFSYADKRQFLRILRAQLSSAEQTLLLFNWLSGHGKEWEEDASKPNGNHFFSDYRMIHNIIPEQQPFTKESILQSILSRNPHYKKLNNEDTLFELIDEKRT